MTRYTKMGGKKQFEQASTDFNVTPLLPRREGSNNRGGRDNGRGRGGGRGGFNARDGGRGGFGGRGGGRGGFGGGRGGFGGGRGGFGGRDGGRGGFGGRGRGRGGFGGIKRGRDDDWEENKRSKTSDVCFACRKKGHSVNNCPENRDHAKICYNCGSTEHSLKECRKQRKKNELPYATCFVCNEEGHLSGQCPKNERGLYPNGGSCRFCEQVDHLAKDCPITKEQAGTTVVGTINLDQGADDDDYHIFVTEKEKMSQDLKKEKKIEVIKKSMPELPTKKKIVKF